MPLNQLVAFLKKWKFTLTLVVIALLAYLRTRQPRRIKHVPPIDTVAPPSPKSKEVLVAIPKTHAGNPTPSYRQTMPKPTGKTVDTMPVSRNESVNGSRCVVMCLNVGVTDYVKNLPAPSEMQIPTYAEAQFIKKNTAEQ